MDGVEQRRAIEALMHAHGESCASLSRLLGRNPAYFQQYLRRGSPRLLPERERIELARYFRVPESQLGGPERNGGTQEPAMVARLDLGASAGPGRLADAERAGRSAMLDGALLRRLGVRPQSAALLRVEGRSMEPTLRDGDEILVDRDRRAPGPRGGLFVLRRGGELFVKRLSRIGQALEAHSDNAAEGAAFPVGEDCDVIGRVVWLSRALL